jgi:FK506-binding nuclear protein
MDDEPASMWAFAIPPGGRLTQAVPKLGCVCLTSAVLADPCAERVVLTVTSGGISVNMCNLFGDGDSSFAQLGQPFHEDFELSISGGNSSVHVSGFFRGDLGLAEIMKASPREASKASSSSSSERVKLSRREEEDEDEEEDEGEEEEEGDDDDFDEEGQDDFDDEEDGEEEDDDDDSDDEDGEDDDDDDDDAMPLAPKSVEAILRGGTTAGGKRDAPAASVGANKKAKVQAGAAQTSPAPAPAPAAPAAAKKQKPAPTFRKLPSGLELQDVSVGQGPLATPGRKVQVKYAGTLTSGKQFDAGSIGFKLGGGEVIKGWDEGIKGMKVGGRRKLRIPAHLAYGKRGAPPTIPPNATLLFDVQLNRC